ncbi:MAG TPA: SDR family oxidoreductase [Kofleriaceae bacterium]|jgi:NAD(P)-dependent dehydrogenase (short-subunit alcohol dehydrogenase family)
MKVEGSVALVTGANRGIGLALAKALLNRGARKVYAAARDPHSIVLPRVERLALDVTDPAQVAAAVSVAGDVQIVINNAGISRRTSLLAAGAADAARAQFETNAIGPLAVASAFAPTLARNGGGAIVNVLSALSWGTLATTGTYSASKAAAWALTNGLRIELAAQGTQVLAVHMGFVDTDMTKALSVEKVSADDVARRVLDALDAGESEVLADATAQYIKQGLSQGIYLAEPQVR